MSNLVFYEGWLDGLKALRKFNGDEFVKNLAWEILNYGIKGECETDDQDLINYVISEYSIQISKAQNRYKACKDNGVRGGRPEQYSTDDICKMHEQGLSNQEIANKLGCSTKTVERKIGKIELDDLDI